MQAYPPEDVPRSKNRFTPTAEDLHSIEAVQQIDSLALQHAIAYYQGSN